MSFTVKQAGEFERFARKIEESFDSLPTLAVTKLANVIISQKLFTRTSRGQGVFRGPGGRFIVGEVESLTTVGQNIARAVLELSPEVRFIEVYPRTKRVLAFDWFDAPAPVRAKFAKTWPRVFFAHTRVPVRLKAPDLSEPARQAFSSSEFQDWLRDQIQRGLIR